MTINTIDALRGKLVENGIDLSLWGQGEAKTIEQLYTEICLGECELVFKGEALTRLVRVALAIVPHSHHINLRLVVVTQLFADGRVRKFEQANLPGGKVMKGESPLSAVRRELWEEAGLNLSEADVPPSEDICEEQRLSPSYPGLLSVYKKHTFAFPRRHNLPQTSFSHVEDNGTTNYFAWK